MTDCQEKLLQKLGVSEWLIKVVQGMYRNAKSRVRVNSSYTESFGVGVGVHQGSVLSPLLFICVLEALSREFRKGSPEELLYADDLVVSSETLDGLLAKLETWKKGLEGKDLRVNMGKTKVMVSGCNLGKPSEKGKFPCSVFGKGVGSNSIYFGTCKHWVHKRCSGIKGKLTGSNHFSCKMCTEGYSTNDLGLRKVHLEGEEIEVVQNFCYLGNASVTARINSGWSTFKELIPLLTSRAL